MHNDPLLISLSCFEVFHYPRTILMLYYVVLLFSGVMELFQRGGRARGAPCTIQQFPLMTTILTFYKTFSLILTDQVEFEPFIQQILSVV